MFPPSAPFNGPGRSFLFLAGRALQAFWYLAEPPCQCRKQKGEAFLSRDRLVLFDLLDFARRGNYPATSQPPPSDQGSLQHRDRQGNMTKQRLAAEGIPLAGEYDVCWDAAGDPCVVSERCQWTAAGLPPTLAPLGLWSKRKRKATKLCRLIERIKRHCPRPRWLSAATKSHPNEPQ